MLQLHRQGRGRRDVHDVGPLDAAAAADRPGDDHLPEVLHADRGRDVPGRDGVDVLAFPAAWFCAASPTASITRPPMAQPADATTSEPAQSVASRASTASSRRRGRCARPTRGKELSMDAINWHTFFFLLFALVACAFAVAVVLSEQHRADGVLPGRCRWAAVAGLFFLAGADFLGAMQLMIYVGGTLVLLVFGVMLTARGPFVSHEDRRRRSGSWPRSSAARCWPCCCRRPFSVRRLGRRRRRDAAPRGRRRAHRHAAWAWG